MSFQWSERLASTNSNQMIKTKSLLGSALIASALAIGSPVMAADVVTETVTPAAPVTSTSTVVREAPAPVVREAPSTTVVREAPTTVVKEAPAPVVKEEHTTSTTTTTTPAVDRKLTHEEKERLEREAKAEKKIDKAQREYNEDVNKALRKADKD